MMQSYLILLRYYWLSCVYCYSLSYISQIVLQYLQFYYLILLYSYTQSLISLTFSLCNISYFYFRSASAYLRILSLSSCYSLTYSPNPTLILLISSSFCFRHSFYNSSFQIYEIIYFSQLMFISFWDICYIEWIIFCWVVSERVMILVMWEFGVGLLEWMQMQQISWMYYMWICYNWVSLSDVPMSVLLTFMFVVACIQVSLFFKSTFIRLPNSTFIYPQITQILSGTLLPQISLKQSGSILPNICSMHPYQMICFMLNNLLGFPRWVLYMFSHQSRLLFYCACDGVLMFKVRLR